MKYVFTLILILHSLIPVKSQSITGIIDSLCVYPKVGIAIYKHESNFGKSTLARTHNNVFGIKTRVKVNGRWVSKYKRYPSKEASVKHYSQLEKKWIEKYNIKNRKEYISRLSKFYAHTNKVHWVEKINELM